MTRLLCIAVLAISTPALADTNCFNKREINQLVKSNGLIEYGSLTIDPKTKDIAFINEKSKRYLSVKQSGECYFEPTFLTKSQYEERYQFEGGGEGE